MVGVPEQLSNHVPRPGSRFSANFGGCPGTHRFSGVRSFSSSAVGIGKTMAPIQRRPQCISRWRGQESCFRTAQFPFLERLLLAQADIGLGGAEWPLLTQSGHTADRPALEPVQCRDAARVYVALRCGAWAAVEVRLLWHVRGPSGDVPPPRAGVPRVRHRSGISPPSPSGRSIGSASSCVRRSLPAKAPHHGNATSDIATPPHPNAALVRPAWGKPCAAPPRGWGNFPAHIRTGFDRSLVARLEAR